MKPLSTFRDYANAPKSHSICSRFALHLVHTLRCTTDIFQVKVVVTMETHMLFYLILRRAEALRIYTKLLLTF